MLGGGDGDSDLGARPCLANHGCAFWLSRPKARGSASRQASRSFEARSPGFARGDGIFNPSSRPKPRLARRSGARPLGFVRGGGIFNPSSRPKPRAARRSGETFAQRQAVRPLKVHRLFSSRSSARPDLYAAFLPTPPRGRRPCTRNAAVVPSTFLPTPPRGRRRRQSGASSHQ